MPFESYKRNTQEESKNSKEKPESSLFEAKKNIKGFDISAKVKKDGSPMEFSIDFTKKKVEVNITPEGIKKGIETANSFLHSPQAGKLIEWITKKKEELSKNADPYSNTKDEWKKELDIICEIMDERELGRPDTPERADQYMKEMRKRKAEQTIREYAKQEGKTVKEVAMDLLSDKEEE